MLLSFTKQLKVNGDWGLGIGDWGLDPIPNPQSPIPNPQNCIICFTNSKIYLKLLITIK